MTALIIKDPDKTTVPNIEPGSDLVYSTSAMRHHNSNHFSAPNGNKFSIKKETFCSIKRNSRITCNKK